MTNTQVTVLGLGAMGKALAATFLTGGVSATVWNRTAGRDAELVAAGAVGAGSVAEAIDNGEVIIAVLLDHASVHQTLDPVVSQLRGKRLINLTSTAPEESRELARWADEHGIEFLDGGIMAVPSMIGTPASSILYSGDKALFEAHRATLELLGTAEFLGDDPGLAALYDFSLLSGMYMMFAGFFHGAAMMSSAGVSAQEFAQRAVPWVTAMAQGFPGYAGAIDSRDYSAEVQHLEFQQAAVNAIVRASRDAGVATDLIAPIAELIDRQIRAGHGAAAFARTIEELR
ncbi:NAD(P)-dependent oxidoreductase [Nocardia sp. 2]|uniref:NAD(P)-dependent oxidoreductase n=1 Tax=Nocardia acididurans TaxID=2802282 RepID=A0ABS1M8G2_9NOCA|nr:NAD(P)-binding domain-containing protein [Nocardia acididurans]MBL1076933.1 NAD(P)-dependent oxidoreductase [Nocardia acididurans]